MDKPPRSRAGLLVGLAVLCLAGGAAAVVVRLRRPGGPPPNVLLLVMDTTRADRCSVNGYSRPTTPRLAEFAKDAVTFREAWSPANWTGPAHASLFTGMSVELHGFFEGARPYLAPGVPTLAARFASGGYATGCFTNNEFISPEFGLAGGFEKYEPLYKDPSRPRPWAHGTHELAAAWAETAHAAGRPFFLFVNDVEPHLPYEPVLEDAAPFVRTPTTWAETTAARSVSAPAALEFSLGRTEMDPQRIALLSDLYDAEIVGLDRAIGELLDRFRRGGLLDSTVVVIVGDHGEMLGEHHLLGHGVGALPAVLRVPLVVRFPGAFDGGRTVPDVVRLEDVAPTLLELCRLPEFDGIDGRSLTDDLPGRTALAVLPTRGWLNPEMAAELPELKTAPTGVGVRSLYDGRRHLIASGDSTFELYDPRRDPDENDELSKREPDELARMRKLLAGRR